MRAAPESVTRALDELRLCGELRDKAAASIPEIIARSLAVGATWTEIGAALGLTKHAAWERYHLAAKP